MPVRKPKDGNRTTFATIKTEPNIKRYPHVRNYPRYYFRPHETKMRAGKKTKATVHSVHR